MVGVHCLEADVLRELIKTLDTLAPFNQRNGDVQGLRAALPAHLLGLHPGTRVLTQELCGLLLCDWLLQVVIDSL